MASESIKILAFSTAKQVLGFSERAVEVESGDTVESLVNRITPDARKRCGLARVALDEEFADWSDPVAGHQELAIIPPVSGG